MHLLEIPLLMVLHACAPVLCTSLEENRVQYEILEESRVGSSVGTPVRDAPSYTSSTNLDSFRFELSTDGVYSNMFEINEDTGEVFTNSVIDREELCPYPPTVCEIELEVNVEIRDPDTNMSAAGSSILVTVTIMDINDNAPQFPVPLYHLSVAENTASDNTPIFTAHAVDYDLGPNGEILYSHSPTASQRERELFRIEETTGRIYLTRPLDFETTTQVTLEVKAVDKGEPPRSSEITVIVEVIDINDNPPYIEILPISAGAGCQITENAELGSVLGVVKVTDFDSGMNGHTNCLLQEPTFRLDSISEDVYKIKLASQLDREWIPEYEVAITCLDQGHPVFTSSARITVSVLDVNDNPPVFSRHGYPLHIDHTTEVGEIVLTVAALDLDAGRNAEVTYSLSEEGQTYFTIDSRSGDIRPKVDLTQTVNPPASVTVIATDHGLPRWSSEAQVTVHVSNQN